MTYVDVTAGFAVTEEPVIEDNPVAGLHIYVVAPVAVSPTEAPWQMPGDAGVTDTVGSGLTVTVIVFVDVHPPLVPVTV